MDIILIYFIWGFLIAIGLFSLRHIRVQYILVLLFLCLQGLMTLHEWHYMNKIEDRFFKADELSVLFLTILSLISVPTFIHQGIFSLKRQESTRVIAISNAALVGFIMMMTGVLVSTHLGVLWIFIEATTLTGSILIYHNRTSHSVEATWKYVFLCSIGIALAFAGILFLSMASESLIHQANRTLDDVLSIDWLIINAEDLETQWLQLSFIFILTGFSVKMGTVPLFRVDIDAKDVAPSPVGAMLSAGLMNVGFVAIFRFYEVLAFSKVHDWASQVLLITGFSTLALSAIYIAIAKNYKRLLGYSSMEHGGIALMALACGPKGYFAAVLHLIVHALIKSSLFFQIGQIYRLYGSKSIDQVGGYYRINPVGGFVFLIGICFALALPPSGLFTSELMTFQALFEHGHIEIALLSLLIISTILYNLAQKAIYLLFHNPHYPLNNAAKISSAESISQFILLGAVLVIGVNPPEIFMQLIQAAILHLPH